MLHVHKQNAYVHAIVAWRSADALTLLNLWHLPESEVAKFRQFFRKEVEVYDKVQGTASLEAPVEETPLRIARQLSSASSSCSKQPWSVRAQLDFGSDCGPRLGKRDSEACKARARLATVERSLTSAQGVTPDPGSCCSMC